MKSDQTKHPPVDKSIMWTYFVHMRTVPLRDLRNNFSKLEAWLEEGEQIQIEKRGIPIALLTALPIGPNSTPTKPNFTARRKAIWGTRVFSPKEVKAMRQEELEEEEG